MKKSVLFICGIAISAFLISCTSETPISRITSSEEQPSSYLELDPIYDIL